MPSKELPIRPLTSTFDPVGSDAIGKPDLDFVSLFREEKVPEDAPLVLYPEELGVPWHTSLPWVRQSKFWAQAEKAGRHLVTQLSLGKVSERGKLPMEMEDERCQWKIDELVENAISCCTYLYPTSSPTRLALLTQSTLLLFLHDGTSFGIIRALNSSDNIITDVIERGATQNVGYRIASCIFHKLIFCRI